MRLVVVACALQLSGSSHVLVSAFYGADADCIDVCESPGGDDHRCPPGCPDCSCPHGRLPSLPPEIELTIPEMLAWEWSDPPQPYRSGVPPSPPLAGLDRPPRA